MGAFRRGPGWPGRSGGCTSPASRRSPGAPRQAHLHLPLLGLTATMALGAMIILDAATGRYGLYAPRILLVHGLTGAMLFVLPALWLHGSQASPSAMAPPGAWAWAAWCGAGLALAAMATGRPWPLALGLAGLGAGCLGFGLPAARQPGWAWVRA